MTRFRVLALVPVAILAASLAFAQAPDCTGISTAFNTDPDYDGELTAVRVASGLLRPLLATSPPGDVDRLFIVEQDGLIKILKNGVLLPDPFIDLGAVTRSPGDGGGNEQGLLALAFHPDYDTNGWFFVWHTNSAGNAEVLARYTRDAVDPDKGDPATRVVALTVSTQSSNHNGGMLAFSPLDGRLYLGLGDGGGSCDPSNNGENINTLLGSLLRLDVDSLPYATTGNPYDGATPGADEIWAYGLRNPYRMSIDRQEGTIYIGDVGQGKWEEIDCQPPTSTGGENYGWDNYEGSECPNPSCAGSGSCTIPDHSPPVREYNQAGQPCAVTGGYVYRGCRMPDLRGSYFYADYCAAFLRSFRTDATCSAAPDIIRTTDLAPGGTLVINAVSSFGEDERGEIYIVDRGSTLFNPGPVGEVYKILPVLGIMEVSGPNATQLIVDASGAFVWENLRATSSHEIQRYRIYRSGDPAATFSCVGQTLAPIWATGDPATPDPGAAFFYLVTARATTEESSAGRRSDGTGRSVNTGSLCM